MFSITRLGSRLLVLGLLATTIGLFGFVLHPLLGGPRPWLLESPSTTDISQFRLVCNRLVADRGDLERSPTAHWGVLLGGSTTIEGVDPENLKTGDDWRWLTLAGYGANAGVSCEFAEYALRGGRRLDALVFGLNEGQFASFPSVKADRVNADLFDLRFRLKRREWSKVKDEVEQFGLIPWNLALPNRSLISYQWERDLIKAQQDIMEGFGFGLQAIYEPMPSPWTLPHPFPNLKHKSAAEMEYLHYLRVKNGFYSLSQYPTDGPNIRAMARVTRKAWWLGIAVVLVLLPEKSDLRDSVPVHAVDHIREGLKHELGPEMPVILDFRRAIDDDKFLDDVHLQMRARVEFTHLLSDRLREVLNP